MSFSKVRSLIISANSMNGRKRDSRRDYPCLPTSTLPFLDIGGRNVAPCANESQRAMKRFDDFASLMSARGNFKRGIRTQGNCMNEMYLKTSLVTMEE